MFAWTPQVHTTCLPNFLGYVWQPHSDRVIVELEKLNKTQRIFRQSNVQPVK